jgi:predicted permease
LEPRARWNLTFGAEESSFPLRFDKRCAIVSCRSTKGEKMLNDLVIRLRALFQRNTVERELDDELGFHFNQQVEKFVQSGRTLPDARRSARLLFGGSDQIKEECRDARGVNFLETLAQDVRYALRILRKSPGFTAIAIISLAVGIGANTTIFSWTRAVLLHPLPGARDPGKIIAIESLAPSGEWLPTSYPDFRDLRDHTRSLESITLTYPMALVVAAGTNAANSVSAERLPGELVSGAFFDVLGVQPELGRFFSGSERDDAQNAHAVAVISHSLWVNRYHSDPSAIGTTLRINRYPFTIIGVAPQDFHGSMPGLDFEVWTPVTMFGRLNSAETWMLENRAVRMFRALARLRPGANIQQSRAEVQALAAHIAQANQSDNKGIGAAVLPVWKSHYGVQDALRAPLALLSGACGVVLLIVCANLANLLLAQATNRQKEFSLRLALGAPRSRLVRQLFTETSLLAAAGALLGLVCTFWLSGSLRWLMPISGAGTLLSPQIDSGVFLFTAGLALAAALLAGIAPALHGTSESVNDALKENARGGSGGLKSQRLRSLLVASEVALAVIAIIGAGLFLKSFDLMRTVRPGFQADGVIIGQFSMSTAGHDAAKADAFCRRLREQLEQQPGVTAVSYADYVPLSVAAGSWEDLQVAGYVPGASENMKIYRSVIAPGYFNLLKIPMLAGRDFDANDDSTHAPVMIVNHEFVRRFLPNQYPIGRKVNGWGKWFTIVGEAQDIKNYRLTESATPYFYVPMRQVYRPEFVYTFFVRAAGSMDGAIATLRREAQAVDPAVPVFNTATLGEFISASLFEAKIAAGFLSILAGVSFLLAAIGLYGVIAYLVKQRTREIGIRMAMGAQRLDVLWIVARHAMICALAGLIVGVIGAAALARIASAMLFSVSPADPAVYLAAGACTAVVAMLAAVIPASRAMRIDPMVALRY